MGKIDLGIPSEGCCLDDIKEQYSRMLSPLKERLGDSENGLTSMPFMKGSKFKENYYEGKPIRILFVGRAVNGWEIEFKEGSMSEKVEQIFSSSASMKDIGSGKVMDEEGNVIYNYNRSPFFQLCHAILNLYGLEDGWSERMAWTNLYKVAPFKSGNPNNDIIRETLNDCAKVLGMEISYLEPTHIVFITDNWWYKPVGKGFEEYAFIKETGVDIENETNQIIVGSGISDSFDFRPKIVITKRPESANATRIEHAEAIINAFKDIDSKKTI